MVVDFDKKNSTKSIFGMDTELYYLLSYINQVYILVHHGKKFYDRNINSYNTKKYVDGGGSGVKPKLFRFTCIRES